jgi:hypothetical protein
MMTKEEYRALIEQKLSEGAELNDIPKVVVSQTEELSPNENADIYQYLIDKNLINPAEVPENGETGEEYTLYD